MGKIIAVANQKGGVGKTTSVINLTAGLGKSGKKCLLVEIDSQGNSTSGLGINKREVERSTYDLLTGEERASQVVLKTEFKNVDLIPSSIDLAAAEIELVELEERPLASDKGDFARHDPDKLAAALLEIYRQRAVRIFRGERRYILEE